MKRLLILLCCAGFLFCGKDDDNNPVGPSANTDIYPLAVGNSWLYEVIYFGQNGYETSRDSVEVSVVRDTLIDGERWYQRAVNSVPTSGFCTIRSDGFWVGWPTSHLEFKYPARIGDQYTINSNQIVTVEDDSNVVFINGNEYCCISYVINIPNHYPFGRAKLSPGIGQILEESWAETNDHQMYMVYRSTLLSYIVQ